MKKKSKAAPVKESESEFVERRSTARSRDRILSRYIELKGEDAQLMAIRALTGRLQGSDHPAKDAAITEVGLHEKIRLLTLLLKATGIEIEALPELIREELGWERSARKAG